MTLYRIPKAPPSPPTWNARVACSVGFHDWIGPEQPFLHGRFVVCASCPCWLLTEYRPAPSVRMSVSPYPRPRGPDCSAEIGCACGACSLKPTDDIQG